MTQDAVVPPLPPAVPQVRSRTWRWLGRAILRLGGWRVTGTFPDLPKVVLIMAPHSSNWDGLWGLAAKVALGLEIRILGKHQLFWWPLGTILRRMGVIAVNRNAAHGVVEQVAAMIHAEERCWVGLAPEGTRKRVERWKPGFWKIAKAADVPVLPVYMHYPDKTIGVGAPIRLGEHMETDIARIRDWYRPWQGKNHGV